MESRPPPPTGHASLVSRFFRRTYPYSLHPVVITLSAIACIWSLIAGGYSFRDVANEDGVDGARVYDLIQGVLLIITAIIGAYGVYTGLKRTLKLSRILLVLAPLGAALATGSALVNIIETVELKTDIINACVNELQNEGLVNATASVYQITLGEAQSACNSDWNRQLWRGIIWIVVIAIICFLFITTALAFHRQLLDPSSVSSRNPRSTAVPQSSYQMQGYPPHQSGPQGGQPGWVPPYPGPPPAGSPFAPVPGYSNPDSKSEVPGYDTTYEAQEQAWREAQQNGPTAHFTGNGTGRYAPPAGPPPDHTERGGGYVVEEEEEAWRRAREEGVTAHLTGDRLGESGRQV